MDSNLRLYNNGWII